MAALPAGFRHHKMRRFLILALCLLMSVASAFADMLDGPPAVSMRRQSPQAFNQNGYTGMAGCGTHHPGGNAGPASSGSTTQILINALQYIIVCQQSDYNSGIGWHPDNTALRLVNRHRRGLVSRSQYG